MSTAAPPPRIDEHEIEIAAPPARVWPAVVEAISRTTSGRASDAIAGALGCEPRRPSGHPPEVGSAIVGFRVARAKEPSELALEGSHRFSRYALVFRIDDLGKGRARVRAESLAEFPGAKGRVYRALVIGTRGHVLAVRRILGTVRRRAEAR